MKIIKQGTLPSERTYRCTCSRCHTEFEFSHSEGTPFYDWMDGVHFLTIACPLCEKNVAVSEANYVKSRAK